MIRGLAILSDLLTAFALLFGVLFPGQPEEPLSVTRRINAASGPTLRPGESTVDAVRFLRTLRADPSPPPVPAEPPPPPPPPLPPQPDVSATLKAALTAIRRDTETGSYVALVRDPAVPGPQITSMFRGSRFGDGWRVTGVSADSVTLSKGRETRVVRLYD